ncbi:hypothetical protein AGMMS4957_02400 [Bacteroidia bacterium]|nr:hypothetical protein AGMMS4957_02400 [Bacteroidia bacterium]
MNKVKVLGYSERGIFNSIVFYLREHSEDISGFLSELDIKDVFFDDKVSYTFLNEQSFSEFGDNDWTIIAEKGNEKRVIFIEGKVKTFKGRYSIDNELKKILENKNYKGVSSNIFAQLYYKYLLAQLGTQPQINSSIVGKQVKKIGSNGIVTKTYDTYIRGASSFYYVAILPTELSTCDFITHFKDLGLIEKEEPNRIIRCAYWGNIESFFKKLPANEVIENFEFNRGQIY